MFFVGAFLNDDCLVKHHQSVQSMFGLSAGTAALYVSLCSIASSKLVVYLGSLSESAVQALLIIYSVIET